MSDELSDLQTEIGLPAGPIKPPDMSGLQTDLDREIKQRDTFTQEGLNIERQSSDALLKQADAEEQQADQLTNMQPPVNHLQDVMKGAPMLMMLTAIGGGLGKGNGMAMLQGMTGMMTGLTKGSEQQYQDAYNTFNSNYNQMKDRLSLKQKVYNERLQAYGGRADAAFKAAQAADRTVGDIRQREQDLLQQFHGEQTLMLHVEQLKRQLDQNREKTQSEAALLDEDTLDYASTLAMLDPASIRQFVPSMGAKGMAVRNQINQAMGIKLREAGVEPADVVQMRAMAKAEGASITQLVKQKNAVASFEGVAKFNGERLLQLFDKLGNTDLPIVEASTRLAEKAGGSADAAEFKSVLQTYQTEVARILNNPNLTGQLTDTARKEMQDVVSGNLTTQQAKRVINRLSLEMDMRKASLNNEIKEAQQTMTSRIDGNADAGAKTVVRKGMFNGKSVIEYSDGSVEYGQQ